MGGGSVGMGRGMVVSLMLVRYLVSEMVDCILRDDPVKKNEEFPIIPFLNDTSDERYEEWSISHSIKDNSELFEGHLRSD